MIKYLDHIANVSPESQDAEIQSQIKRDFGAYAEPFELHAPSPPLLAGVWMATREAVLAGQVRRGIKETVATCVSRINQCPYCVDAHTIMLHAVDMHKDAGAIDQGQFEDIQDTKLRLIAGWALATRSPDNPILHSPPFRVREAPEIIGTAFVFHYINRMVDIFLDETPLPVNIGRTKGILRRMAGWYFSRAAQRPKQAGQSLDFLPAARLAPDMSWAKASPEVATAFARWTAAMEAAGRNALSHEVRELVHKRVAAWQGEDLGMSRHWVEEALGSLDEREKPAGRLALLAALAPYQVDDSVIISFCAENSDGEKLVGAVAWAAHTVARRIGTWLWNPLEVLHGDDDDQ